MGNLFKKILALELMEWLRMAKISQCERYRKNCSRVKYSIKVYTLKFLTNDQYSNKKIVIHILQKQVIIVINIFTTYSG